MSAGRGFRLRYAYTGYNTEHRTPLRRLINFLCNLTTRHCENGENYATAHRNFPRFLIITSDALLPPPPSFHPPPSPKLGADLTREIFNFSGGPDLFVYSGSLYVRTLSVWSVSDLSSVKWNWSKVVDGMLRKVFQVIDRSIDNVEDDLKLGISIVVILCYVDGECLISLIGKLCPYVGSDTLVRVWYDIGGS